ncbi:response regulator [Methanocalculus chunghsingensis]|uniref:response regulator n=1 Tax=Methanocalculus chunghsingensis TaxID=156457 RepID=UPI001B8C9C5D|nr:response regulator [Methanocalculus chunghsingensis]
MRGDPEPGEKSGDTERLILFVDDNPALRLMIPDVLSQFGYHVMTAGGGEECLEILSETIPDLIVLDIMMEPMDGWATLKAIRNVPAYEDIPILILTGKVFLPIEMIRYGPEIVGWIKKPVRMGEFISLLNKVFADLRQDMTIAERMGDSLTPEERRQIAIHHRRLRVLPQVYDGIICQCLSPARSISAGWGDETKDMENLIAEEERWCREHGILVDDG